MAFKKRADYIVIGLHFREITQAVVVQALNKLQSVIVRIVREIAIDRIAGARDIALLVELGGLRVLRRDTHVFQQNRSVVFTAWSDQVEKRSVATRSRSLDRIICIQERAPAGVVSVVHGETFDL